MDRRTFSTTLLAGAAATMAGMHVEARAAAGSIRNVVLVHGLYADGSCWVDVIGRLQSAGIRATAVQNTLRAFADDVALTNYVLDMQDGPTVLGGHSFGGMIVTQAGVHPKVASLVYVAARAPEAGENYNALAAKFPKPPLSAGIVNIGDDLVELTENAFLNDFANGVAPEKARLLYAVQAANAASLPATAMTTVAAWRSRPSWYAVSTQDRAINPDLERFMAKRMKATTIEVDTGHLSLVSHPQEISDLILAATNAQPRM